MAGLAKGKATTSGWTLVRFDCKNLMHQVRQRRVARARRRWRQQPAHGGCNVQDRTRASIAHDAGDGNIFPPSVDAAARQCAQDHRAPKGSGSERMKRGGGDQKASLPDRLAAARAQSWHRMRRGNYCPAAKKGPSGLGTFWIDDGISGSRRGLVSSEAEQ